MVIDMGEPMKIYDFAQRLITYFGDGRSKVVVTGLRPGEKLYEELLANKDAEDDTYDSTDELLRKLQEVVPEFHYQGPAPLSVLVKEAQ